MASFRFRTYQSLCSSALLAIAPLLFVTGIRSVNAEDVDAKDPAPADAVPTESVPQASAPAELLTMVERMDQAANTQRLKTFIGYFDKSFAHEDGLDRQQLKQSVRSFWKQFDQLTYMTELESWEELSPGVYETVTITTITGQQGIEAPSIKKLTATVKAKQKIQGEKILSQSTLDEQSQVVSGVKPPVVQVNLPKTVKVGEDYFFDVIVDEPLGDRILLGAAIEESVAPQGYLNPSQFEIQSLATGGLFKVGQAPAEPKDQWISALLIQDGGMYMMSQRVSVVPSADSKAQNQSPESASQEPSKTPQ